MAMDKYFKEFEVVEVQETFYNLITEKRAKKWREKAPPEFEFTLKVFQGLTHPPSSPTWRRCKSVDLQKVKDRVGFLSLNNLTKDFWSKMVKIGSILGSKVFVFQLPPSFKENEENIGRIENFFNNIEREGLFLALELRGWDHRTVGKICKKLELIQVFDPLREDPYVLTNPLYVRLHGKIEKGRINYRYKYSDKEIELIYKKFKEYKRDSYILFNNIYMREDAKRLLEKFKKKTHGKG